MILNNTPTGNISMTLSNDFRTTILNYEVFRTPREYNSNGVYSIVSDTLFTSLIYNFSAPGIPTSIFGTPYLTMNYILMDYKNNEFKLAPAQREPYPSRSGPVISAVCRGMSTPSSTTNITTPVSLPHLHNTNTDEIAGGVVGGVLGLILILGSFDYLFWRSNRKKKA